MMPKCIETDLERIEKEKMHVTALIDVAEKAHAIADAFPEMDVRVSVTHWVCEPPFVTMLVYVKSFHELTPMFRALAAAGFHTDKEKPFTDYPEIDRRTYNLGLARSIDPTTGAPSAGHPLRVMAFPTKDGAKCRKVEVGKKEEPVYEFVCDE